MQTNMITFLLIHINVQLSTKNEHCTFTEIWEIITIYLLLPQWGPIVQYRMLNPHWAITEGRRDSPKKTILKLNFWFWDFTGSDFVLFFVLKRIQNIVREKWAFFFFFFFLISNKNSIKVDIQFFFPNMIKNFWDFPWLLYHSDQNHEEFWLNFNENVG